MEQGFWRAIRKVSCLQESAVGSLSVIGYEVSMGYTLPHLGNLCLTADHGCLKLSPTYCDIVIRAASGAKMK